VGQTQTPEAVLFWVLAPLTALAYLFLPCFLVVFYYAMNVSLAHKSWMVAGSGLILLAVRWLLQQRASKEAAQ
jgi:uncharacterized membrane protein